MKIRNEKMHTMYFVPSIIKLGVQRLQCKRWGICEIITSEHFDHLDYPLSGKSYAYIYMVFGRVIAIYFCAKSMDNATLQRHFSRNTFTVEEDFTFQLDMNQMKSFSLIPAGHYNVHLHNDYYIVDLQSGRKQYSYDLLKSGIHNLENTAYMAFLSK